MKWLQVVYSVALAGQLATQATAAEGDSAQPKAAPPVLQSSEPTDSVVLKLPGAPVAPKRAAAPTPIPSPAPPVVAARVAAKAIAEKPPILSPAPFSPPKTEQPPHKLVETGFRRDPPKSPVQAEPRTEPMNAKPPLPVDFTRDSARFCQKQIGRWKQADARAMLGSPRRSRPAYGDDKKSATGRIYAFSDPSGHYRELELDFDKSTGTLRTVFGYPPKLTWKECQRLWGSQVASADASQGRTFYSYLNKRLDVLVDQNGNVISLGLY